VWGFRRPIGAAVVILLVGALAASWIGPLDRDPVLASFRGEMLVLQNKSGQDLREIRVGRPTVEHARLLAAGEVDREVVNFFDVNGDGSKEVLYIVRAQEGSSDPHVVECLGTADDRPMWTFVARFGLDFPHKTDLASDAFRLEEIWTGDSDGDGRAEVILLANHVFFPSVIARLDARTGELQQFYIHVGTLSDLAVVDLEDDGVFEILACGTNNAFNVAGLVVLDPRSLRGHSPTTGGYVMDGVPRATERLYALIPRTAVGEVFAERYERIGGRGLEIEPAGKRFCVVVPDAGGPITVGSVAFDPLLYYYFGFDLKPQRIASSTEFDTVCRLLWERGDLTELPGKAFFEAALKKIRYFQSTSSAVTRSPALSRWPASQAQDSPRSGQRGE
jgi:hypothetical protein